jgi:membrane-associated phospholipid phosphatase
MPIKQLGVFGNLQTRNVLAAIATMIMVAWLIPWTAPLLDQVDEFIFYTLNGSLEWGGSYWQLYWAFANHRTFDATIGVIYLSCFAAYCFWRTDRETAGRRCAELCTLMLTLLLVMATVHVFFEMVHYRRLSPTRVLDSPIRLRDLFPDWDVKDRSSNSYPADHGLVALYLCLYFILRAPRGYAIAFCTIAFIAIMPRLVGGAHWVTDVITGSFFFATIAWCIVEGTGLFDWTAKRFAMVTNRLAYPISGWLQRIPFLRASG